MAFLHYQFQAHPTTPDAPVMLFIHGLFGDMNNLGIIARAFSDTYSILRVDLRNHGSSFHSAQMDYDLMAQDVAQLLDHLQINSVIAVGHSMGGKTAMTLAQIAPQKVEKLIVIDIAPLAYPNNRHESVFNALFAVKAAKPANRQAARVIMEHHIDDENTRLFMLKSFDADSADFFRFNLSGLRANYDSLMGWNEVSVDLPTLFIKGGLSDYIQAKDTATILRQFPQAKSFVIANAQHWVHAEKPEAVVRAITRFLTAESR